MATRPSLPATIATCARVAIVRGGAVLAVAALVFTLLMASAFLLFRVVDPPGSALMLSHRLTVGTVDQRWLPLDAISPNLVAAVIASEDARFCIHRGVDLREMSAAMRRAEATGDDIVRGASTISMQVVKNLFLWQDRTLFRKGLELAMTPIMEVVWSKRRILEVYLNIAEWGPGVFGAEAAARHHFKKSARSLSRQEAALLAAALPNPIVRRAGRAGPLTRRLSVRVLQRMTGAERYTACIDRPVPSAHWPRPGA